MPLTIWRAARDAGIHDGDHVVIRRGTTANSGEIIVALVDGVEATRAIRGLAGAASDGRPLSPALLAELKAHAWARNFYD